ncbi:hypothetical protein EBS02_04090 [bacterium]|nr:hypothetical protein [bacterium]
MDNLKQFSEFLAESKSDASTSGIHPAVRDHLLTFLGDEENRKASFSEVKKYIKSKLPTWNLSQNDYDEAVKLAGQKHTK